MNCPENIFLLYPPVAGREVLEVNILKVREISWTAQKINIFLKSRLRGVEVSWTAEKIDTFF